MSTHEMPLTTIHLLFNMIFLQNVEGELHTEQITRSKVAAILTFFIALDSISIGQKWG